MSTFEFHVARAARERYAFDDALFGLTGNVVFADFAAARRFAQLMNEQRDLTADPGAAVRAGDLNAMGPVDEIMHFVVAMYRRERNPDAMAGALQALEMRLSPGFERIGGEHAQQRHETERLGPRHRRWWPRQDYGLQHEPPRLALTPTRTRAC